MLDNFNALYQDRPNLLTLRDTNLDLLPAKVSKRLWVNPLEFVITVNAMVIAQWALATLFFLDQWRFHMGPRATIERHFAWAKRYFGLESARWRSLIAAYQHTALVYSVMLGVALTAHRFQRPELAGSRTKVLAGKTVM